MVNMGQKHAERLWNCGLQKAKNWRSGRSFATLTFSSTKCLGGSGPRLQDCNKLDNMLLYIDDQKREKEPQDFERFKIAVVQAAVNSVFLAPEALEEARHTVCIRV